MGYRPILGRLGLPKWGVNDFQGKSAEQSDVTEEKGSHAVASEHRDPEGPLLQMRAVRGHECFEVVPSTGLALRDVAPTQSKVL